MTLISCHAVEEARFVCPALSTEGRTITGLHENSLKNFAIEVTTCDKVIVFDVS